jgi:hypothetical protein
MDSIAFVLCRFDAPFIGLTQPRLQVGPFVPRFRLPASDPTDLPDDERLVDVTGGTEEINA